MADGLYKDWRQLAGVTINIKSPTHTPLHLAPR
jgi:hypothetical protein